MQSQNTFNVGEERRKYWRRSQVGSSQDGRLFFAQVREDPRLEIDAMQVAPGKRYVTISSGGCTALSLLAWGAASVTCVDVNRTQNHLVELKMAAVCHLPDSEVLPFLGGEPALDDWRYQRFLSLQGYLSPAARKYWHRHHRCIEKGVLSAGVTERLNRLTVGLCRLLVHKRETLMELLAQPNVDAQAEFYDRVWSNRRWKALFALVYGRRAMSLTYAPGFYARAAQTAFGPGLMGLVEHSLKHIPVGDNYFAYHNITGYYPAHRESALPPYLTRAGMARLREPGESPKLHLVDGSLTEYLGASPPRSVDGIAMSNICEWMNDAQTAGLFEQALRVARPDGIVCFRDHMGVTRVPPEFATQVIELVARGDALIRADRSMVQRGFHILQVRNQPTARAQSVDAAQ